jgi:hypothetical protein
MSIEALKSSIYENSGELATIIAAGLSKIIDEDIFLWFSLDTERNAIIEVCIGANSDEIIHRVKLSEVIDTLLSGNDNAYMLKRFAEILDEEAKRIRSYLAE